MTEPSRNTDLDREQDLAGDDGEYVGRPRWVKWFMAVAAVLVGLYLLLLVVSAGGGDHSPERHQSLRRASVASVTEPVPVGSAAALESVN